ncbi:Hypothetical protein A7982_11434 [Minicystis rosea]|nr:Hypothetical protein A7982_11434 [Minicystis rosea]
MVAAERRRAGAAVLQLRLSAVLRAPSHEARRPSIFVI